MLKYGEAPAGIKEVFELCRGFERAYVSYVNVGKLCGCSHQQSCHVEIVFKVPLVMYITDDARHWISQESPVASKIKEAFMGEKGLAGSVKKLPMEKLFETATVKQVSTLVLAILTWQDACVASDTPCWEVANIIMDKLARKELCA